MTDEVDRADAEIERSLAEAIRSKKPEGPKANGFCAYCNAPTEPGRRWCDAICRDDWEAERG